jgi:hypothetical protein
MKIDVNWKTVSTIAGIALDTGMDDKGKDKLKKELDNMSKTADMVGPLVAFIEKVVKEQISHGKNGDMVIINEGSNLLLKFGIKI